MAADLPWHRHSAPAFSCWNFSSIDARSVERSSAGPRCLRVTGRVAWWPPRQLVVTGLRRCSILRHQSDAFSCSEKFFVHSSWKIPIDWLIDWLIDCLGAFLCSENSSSIPPRKFLMIDWLIVLTLFHVRKILRPFLLKNVHWLIDCFYAKKKRTTCAWKSDTAPFQISI